MSYSNDELKEDRAEDDVLVLRGVHITELVCGQPEFFLKAKVRTVVSLCHSF